jgi:hypothetical protein
MSTIFIFYFAVFDASEGLLFLDIYTKITFYCAALAALL